MNNELLESLLSNNEDYNLEYKEARSNFSIKDLHDYCAAISNERGGYLLLGVNNNGEIVGTAAFGNNWNQLAHKITEHLRIRVKVYKVDNLRGRVLVVEIPQHFSGTPVQSVGGKYRYPIRDGESLVEMDTETLQEIFSERDDDWSADVAVGAVMADLDEDALATYRREWSFHSGKSEYLALSYEQMLSDVGLSDNDNLTNAALLLFANERGLRRFIPDAEIIFEWRDQEADIQYGVRKNWRRGFMGIYDDIWQVVNARNTTFRYQEGFIQRDIPAYDEKSIREAIVNAFAHRDYTIKGHSVGIKLSPGNFFIQNPGKFMPGVTLENILDKSVWRNRLLAESLEKVNIMERSSQGMDTIFRRAIEDGKGAPTIVSTHDPSIELMIPARLADQGFINFLQRVSDEKQEALTVKEIVELEKIRNGVPKAGLQYKDKFLSMGIIEKTGYGRGAKYILAHRYYVAANAKGRHARLSGLSKDVKRTVVVEYLKKHRKLTNTELQDAMPDMSRTEISSLLKSMRKDGIIEYSGASPRWGYWQLKS